MEKHRSETEEVSITPFMKHANTDTLVNIYCKSIFCSNTIHSAEKIAYEHILSERGVDIGKLKLELISKRREEATMHSRILANKAGGIATAYQLVEQLKARSSGIISELTKS